MHAPWHIWVDTGGTFTDAVGVDPAGRTHRVKVLSTGALRRRIATGCDDRGRWAIEGREPAGMFAGWGVGAPGGDDVGRVTAQGEGWIEADGWKDAGSVGVVELRSPEPAPIVAARILTGSVGVMPAMRMRLATTRGTNALLERRVSRVAMFLTRGIEDLLLIGTQQRPDLFSLEIRRPAPLYERAVGIRGRLDARGREREALDLAAAEADARRLLVLGIRHAAVALMHSWVNPAHERAVETMLLAVGFEHVSLSSSLSPTIRILDRAMTALVNAALDGPVSGFLRAVRDRLGPGSTLEVMTSAAGLVPAAEFKPKDSLLSGPAAGVLGASAATRPCITLDMGGTSCDVARRGEDGLDYVFEIKVGPAELVSPAIAVESVAAGGGSVVRYRHGGLQIGPESAGARPGPACYGAGGPLCITDVNLLLGRIDPSRFQVPLDASAAEVRFGELLGAIARERGSSANREDVLGAILATADERMADAVRSVSIRRGYDPADHALVAFGGAGPQHACALAERLGISRIVVPADASLLSAVGLAGAGRERARERQVLEPLDGARLGSLIEELGKGLPGAREVLVSLRPLGQAAGLVVRGGEDPEPRFRARYREVYGHEAPDRPLEVEWVRVIAREPPDVPRPSPGDAGVPAARRAWRLWHGGVWIDATIVDRASLAGGDRVAAPALVADDRSCVVLTPGWVGTASADGVLELTRAGRAIEHLGAAREEILAGRLQTIAAEMGEQLRRTAVSTNVKERLDFSCAILDARGMLIANAPHVPVHLGALGVCVRELLARVAMEPGDSIVTNHPAVGGSHLPDVTVVTPVHEGERLLGFVASRAHHAEIGGVRPGSMPPAARVLAEEGVVIPPMPIVRAGRSRLAQVAEVLAGGPFPTRALEDNLADLRAALAANERGRASLAAFAREHGDGGLEGAMGLLLGRARALAMRALTARAGVWNATESLDDGSPIAVLIDIAPNGRARFDFSGSAATHPGNLNATPAIVRSCVLYLLRVLVGEPIPLSEGLLDDVEIILPPGMLNPSFDLADPANCPAVAAGNTETSQRLTDTMVKALRLAGASQGTMNNTLFGNSRVSYYETIGGGAGAGQIAGRGFAGASGVHTNMTNTRITDAEVLEHRYPVVLERFAIRQGSGGSGRWPGGDGLVREIRFLAAMQAGVVAQRRASGPFGMEGGGPGQPGGQWVVRAGLSVETAFNGEVDVEAGDLIRIKTPGGGGFGA